MKNCVLCYNEFTKECNSHLKLFELCRLYLHSSLTQTQETSIIKSEDWNLPFCSKCFESATELGKLSQQLQCIQKSVSEFTFTFGMEILHRRENQNVNKTDENPEQYLRNKSAELDASASSNGDFFSQGAVLFDSALPETIVEIVDEIDPLVIPLRTEEVRTSEIALEKIKVNLNKTDENPEHFSRQKSTELDVSASSHGNFCSQRISNGAAEVLLFDSTSHETISDIFDEIDPLQMPVLTPEVSTSGVTFEKIKIEKSQRSLIATRCDGIRFEDTGSEKIHPTTSKAKTTNNSLSFPIQCINMNPTVKLVRLSFKATEYGKTDGQQLKISAAPTSTALASSSTSSSVFKSSTPSISTLTRKTKYSDPVEKPFKCELCDKRFLTKERKREHLRNLHDPDWMPAVVDVALTKSKIISSKILAAMKPPAPLGKVKRVGYGNKKLGRPTTVSGIIYSQDHLDENTIIEKWNCETCFREYRSRDAATLHRRVGHGDLKGFKRRCDVCLKDYSFMNFRTHMKSRKHIQRARAQEFERQREEAAKKFEEEQEQHHEEDEMPAEMTEEEQRLADLEENFLNIDNGGYCIYVK